MANTRKYSKQYYEQHKAYCLEQGVCFKCKKPTHRKRVYCVACSEKMNSYSSEKLKEKKAFSLPTFLIERFDQDILEIRRLQRKLFMQ